MIAVTNVFAGTSITEIPENIFSSNANLTQIDGMFSNTKITVIPGNLFAGNPKLTSASQVFEQTAITEVPAGLFAHNPDLSTVTGLFYNCWQLKTVPVGIFDNNRQLSTVTSTFSHCYNYEGESPYTVINVDGNDVKVHLYERKNYPSEFPTIIRSNACQYCFGGCTKLTDYDAMNIQDFEHDWGNWVKNE